MRILPFVILVMALLGSPNWSAAQSIGPAQIAAFEAFEDGYSSPQELADNRACFAEQITANDPATAGEATTLLICLDDLGNPSNSTGAYSSPLSELLCEPPLLVLSERQLRDMLKPKGCDANPEHLSDPIFTVSEAACMAGPACDGFAGSALDDLVSECRGELTTCTRDPADLSLETRDMCRSKRAYFETILMPSLKLGPGGVCPSQRNEAIATVAGRARPQTWQEQVERNQPSSTDEFNLGDLNF